VTAAADTTVRFDTAEWLALNADQLARALIRQKHRVIAAEIDVRFGDETGCGGPSRGAEACGGCRDCVYAQATYLDHLHDGYARWRAQAVELIADVTAELADTGGVR
jgi:hypothetical protein